MHSANVQQVAPQSLLGILGGIIYVDFVSIIIIYLFWNCVEMFTCFLHLIFQTYFIQKL